MRLPWSLIAAWAVLAFSCGPLVAAEEAGGPAWATLSPAQQQALAPLQRDWASIEATRKQKWLEVSARFPAMPPDERARVQQRMADWARLTPAERTRARLQFQEVRQLPAEERQARWQAYQALPVEERKTLAQRGGPAATPAAAPVTKDSRLDGAKRNMVQSQSVQPKRAVAPTVVQAKPGATTTSMATRTAPPAHNQAGLPKIAATPGFVDPATLLPRRGAQGAAVRSAAAATDPAVQP
ncbi:MAG TPA: DUF3106 domain-containing protein [Rubrivivax sp.]|jgi:hypothetical protein|nr:DUF3106 domain-containing protein [Rubrivivax sp.]